MPRPRRAIESAFTIIELMVVVAVAGMLLAAAALSFQNVIRTRLRSAASRTASAMRFAFDRATMTGMTIRVTFDLDKGEVWLEGTTQRVTIGADGAKAEQERRPVGETSGTAPSPFPLFGGGGGSGTAAGETGEGEEEGFQGGIDVKQMVAEVEADREPVQRAEAKFAPLKGMLTKKIKLAKGVHIDAVVTPRQVDPVTEGQAYVYFFPQGHSEPAIVHIVNDDEEYYSVVLHPLTGQAKVYPCMYRIPDDFGVSDEKRSRKSLEPCEDRGGI
jgi:general secretion pathway protein H